MHPLEKKILGLCLDHHVFAPGDRLLIGVSGGPDSMALLHILARLAPLLGVDLAVAHVDHGLRPEATEDEERLVREAAVGLGLDCAVGHLAVTDHAKAQGQSIEEAARDLRYQFFDATAKGHGANKVVVAHTADDQAEEILLRLIRGAGVKGLSGMSLLRDGRVARPLLTTEKADLLSYLRQRNIRFAIDASNADRHYLRNRVRLDLLPFLAKFNPNIRQALRQTATILRDEDALLDDLVATEYALLVRQEATATGPGIALPCAPFTQRPIAIRRRLLEKMLISLGGKPGFKQIGSLIALAAAEGNGQLHLPDGLRAVKASGEMRLFYPCGQAARRGNLAGEPLAFTLSVPVPGRYLLPAIGKEITLEVMTTTPTLAEMRRDTAEFFDLDCLNFPLTIRNRHPGDRFHPMNGRGGKKVADFLSDLKMPPGQRAQVPILLSANQVIALLGVRIDHGVRLTEKTTRVLKVGLTSL